jgi:hypothetical protein
MSELPVINYGRMERLRPPVSTTVQMNLNTFCVILIFICVLVMYKRSIGITQERERFHT